MSFPDDTASKDWTGDRLFNTTHTPQSGFLAAGGPAGAADELLSNRASIKLSL